MVNVLRNSHHAQFPLTDNLMSLVFLVKAGLNENQRERFVTSIMAQYTYLQVKQLCMELFCTTRTGCERWKQPIRKPCDNALANCIPLVYMTLPPTNVWSKLQVKPYSKLYHVHCFQTYIPWQLGPQLAANYQRLWDQIRQHVVPETSQIHPLLTFRGKGAMKFWQRSLSFMVMHLLVHRTGIPEDRT